ncbi:MAG TPA: biopolymer transporter ExbD [Patescibacteria group bacterium]|nr:biopolymer transporter ExbD [Patescibacteria group bacterium]
MRIARSSSANDEFEINVISLIDVMLTLLMFFVMTATFENRALMKVALPEADSRETAAAQKALEILVDREGRFFIGANEVINPGLATLKEAIAREAGDDRERPVTLRADGKTPHQAVVTAMDALGQLGFARLSIATVPAKADAE